MLALLRRLLGQLAETLRETFSPADLHEVE